MSEKGNLTDLRRKVLEHIDYWTKDGGSCRVPDGWIEEADQSVKDGQSTPRGLNGRKLTPAGRLALQESSHEH